MDSERRPDSYSHYPQVSGELFREVQESGVYSDCKYFVDAIPNVPPEVIWERYHEERTAENFDLKTFVDDHFTLPEPPVRMDGPVGTTLEEHIDALWDILRRDPVDPPTHSTHLALPEEYIIPGGRFREMYYWDTYFTSEGLATSGRLDRVENIVKNFKHLINTHGFIPNATRVYYLSRSDPPLFHRHLMILEREAGFDTARKYLPEVEDEYRFWMDGHERLDADTPTVRRVVQLDPDTVLNRYWDSDPRPRPEAYAIDRKRGDSLPPEDRTFMFRGLRAACESGWDFSSRWLADPNDITTVRTTDLIPVDLNAFLYEREAKLAEWLHQNGQRVRAQEYEQRAAARRDAINTYCWDNDNNVYADYCWPTGETSFPTVATAVPLFTGVATDEHADKVATQLRDQFLHDGGLVTTLQETGHQWDKPCGWAPYQWMAIMGLRRYGHEDLAREIASRWVSLVRETFHETGQVLEKYDVCAPGVPDTGEYPLQEGFGWTNGVVTALQSQFEELNG